MHFYNKTILKKSVIYLLKILPSVFWMLLIFGFDTANIGLATIICALLHELGHLFATYIISPDFSFKAALSGFRLSFKSVNSYKDEIIIAAAGPAMNIFLSLIFGFFSGGHFFTTFSVINLMTAICNLIPIEGYDGYRILSCTFSLLFKSEAAQKILKVISFSTVLLLCFLSLYIMARLNSGYWIYFIFIAFTLKKIINDRRVFYQRKREKTRDFVRFQEIFKRESKKTL